jgi:GDP-L-fucose synthase
MALDSKIFVAGHNGLVGSAICRRLESAGHSNVLTRSHSEIDLQDQAATREFFEAERPEQVYLAAAKVGGINANNSFPAQFIHDNLAIALSVIDSAYQTGVEKLLFLGSSCIYPKLAPQPMPESCLLTGELEPTNEPYALAKIAGIKLCESYNREYGTNFFSAMPTNLYGIGDNFDLETSHVLPALLRKCHEAREQGDKSFVVWGSGTPMREFLYADDLADACVFLMENCSAADIGSHINIGTGSDVTIRELAELICETVGFEGELVFDATKPDGTPRKLLDVSRMTSLGWTASTPLRDGLKNAYEWYLSTL